MLDLKRLKLQYVTDKGGEKKAVILPIEEFEELIEDIEDLAAVAERREEPTVPHAELITELKRDGLI
jgi:PHD/YefM family antitoxin component YafN of YafNO toxin-antitoxin module